MIKKKIKPDYDCHHTVLGSVKEEQAKAKKLYGHFFDWPRWFDDKRKKRKVVITIEKFYGDYHHWYVVVEEEDNPFWLPPGKEYREGVWVEDGKARGEKFSEQFNTNDGAQAYADIIIRDHFPNHRATIGEGTMGTDTNKTWHYSREGD